MPTPALCSHSDSFLPLQDEAAASPVADELYSRAPAGPFTTKEDPPVISTSQVALLAPVAVAVSASSGTPGSESRTEPSLPYSTRKSVRLRCAEGAGAAGSRDSYVMIAATLAIFVMAMNFKKVRRINRFEGGILLAGFIAYQFLLFS